ncbi:MAG: glycosyltransferase family 4 protein [Actinomycetota bacterium]|nr:glycosyltransferase family 4 protein [Actinomycetota bacterium]
MASPVHVTGPPAERLRVLRVCSVYEARQLDLTRRTARFDPVGGMQHHTAQLARELDCRGVAQTVLTSRLAGRAGQEPLGRYGTIRRTGFPLARLRQLWSVGAFVHALGRRTPPVDLVHAHQGEDIAALAIALLAARRRACPLVVTLHCSVRHTFRAWSWRARLLRLLGGFVEKAAIDRADAVITLTASAARRCIDGGKGPGAVRVIPSGVDPTRFTAGLPDPFPQIGRPRIVYVGRLAPQKSVTTLVDAFCRMPVDPSQLVIVGDGPERSMLESKARRSAHRDRIHFTGFVPHREVPAVLAHADVLALPSRYEELGSVLVEGMQSGVAIVASSVGGIPEVIEHGRTGLLVPPGNATTLATALRSVLTRPGLARQLGDGARERARRYRWDNLTGEVLQVYADVVGSARAPDVTAGASRRRAPSR